MREGPLPLEDLLASATQGLKVRGDARSVAVILESEAAFEYRGSEFSFERWFLLLKIVPQVFYSIEEEEREASANAILDACQPFFRALESDSLDRVMIIPRIMRASDGWREDAKKFVRGEGVTNQGRAHSRNVATKVHHGLLFRSAPEIVFFDAVRRAGFTVAPLPVFVGRRRFEPDFMLVHEGLAVVVEIDGEMYHHETPSAAAERLAPLTNQGVEVKRFPSSAVSTPAQADAAVQKLREFIEMRKKAR